jgi:peptidoglycan/LPS O-acetylase OafA/YrhL
MNCFFLLYRWTGKRTPKNQGPFPGSSALCLSVLALLLISLALNFLFKNEVYRFYFPWTRAWELLAGVLTAVVGIFSAPRSRRMGRRQKIGFSGPWKDGAGDQ